MKENTSVVIFSGGMDSTTLLYDVINRGYQVHAITFDYQQKHRIEIEYAVNTCKNLNIPHKIINLSVLSDLAPSSLTRKNSSVPEGQYDDDSMKQTVVPNRNMVFISLAASYAIGIPANHLFYAAHSGDHAIYPDCRPVFVNAMQTALHLCDWNDLDLHAPYLKFKKSDILKIGFALGVDYRKTWSCYNGERLACGKCGACTERLEAFKEINLKDPLDYKA